MIRNSIDINQYLNDVYYLESIGKYREASKLILKYIVINSDNIENINSLIISINIQKLSVWSISALTRYTFKDSIHIPSWHNFINNVKKELSNKGFEVNKILVGII